MVALANGWVGSMDAIMVWACMHWPMDGLAAWTVSWFAHGCTGQWMSWQHGCYHGLGLDALANGWVGRMDASMFGHGCTGPWMGL